MNLLTTKEAARLLGITPQRVGQMIKNGQIPAVKHGRDWLIQQKDLDALVRRGPGRPGK